MQLLVTTPLQVLMVDPANGHTSILRAGDGYYFGLTHHAGTIVLSHSGGYLQYFNRNRRPVQSIDHLIQPHQIEWVGDTVLVTNTGRNCLSVFDAQGNLSRDVYLNEVRWDDKDRGRLGNHFNSVHKVGESIYVVAHNYARPSEVWELTWPELQVANKYTTRAAWAHNIWRCELGLLICNSKEHSLYDVITGENIWQAGEETTITRGLAATQETIFVGQSLYSERKERYWKSGAIWIIDRKTLKTIEYLPLPGSGDIYEIRLVGVPDDCHNSETILPESLAGAGQVSQLIAMAYRLRRRYLRLQQDIFPVSQLVRTVQMSARWKRSLQRTGRALLRQS
jgi:hypothetical protein